MTDLPDPLIAPTVDLRDFRYMQLDVARLRDSELVAEEEPEAICYALLLWAASWHQVPAGSVPNKDSALMRLVGLGRDKQTWDKHKRGALRGFILCSDNRLYHPVVAAKAEEAWKAKLGQRHRTYCAAVRKHNSRHEDDQREQPDFDQWVEMGQPKNVTRTKPNVTETGSGTGRENVGKTGVKAGHKDKAATTGNVTGTNSEVTKTTGNVTRTTQNVTGDIASKGEGEGEGEGDSIDVSLHSTSTTGVDDDLSDDEGSGSDIDRLVIELAGKAGLNVSSPAKRSAAVDQLLEWMAEGFGYETVIRPAVEKATAANPDTPVHSLKYFDAAVRKAAAIAKSKPKTRSIAPAARDPIPIKDTDCDVARRMRAGLERHVTPFHYRQYCAPKQMAITVDRDLIECVFATPSARAIIVQSDDMQHFEGAAKALGHRVKLSDFQPDKASAA